MDRRHEAAAVDRSFIATFRTLTEGVAGALVRTIGGIPVAATMLPLAFFNAAFVTEPLPGGATDLEAAVTLLRRLGIPFTVHLRLIVNGQLAVVQCNAQFRFQCCARRKRQLDI